MSKYSELLEVLTKSGEGSRGGHIIGHTKTGKPVYSGTHATHQTFASHEHRDAMNHHYNIWHKTQEKIRTSRATNAHWNPPEKVLNFVRHHHHQMRAHSAQATIKEGREEKKEHTMVKSGEITPFYSAMVVVDPYGRNILLGKRREDGIWTGPGGGAKMGEMPKKTAIREAFEEANLRIHEYQLTELPMGYSHNMKPVHCYLVRLTEDQMRDISVVNDPDKEVPSWKWFPLNEKLPDPISQNRFDTILNAKMFLAGIIHKSYLPLDMTEGMTQVNTAEEAIERRESPKWMDSITRIMEFWQDGQEPATIYIGKDTILHLVRVEDGVFSGFVKKEDEDGTEESVATIDKMSMASMIQYLKTKELLEEQDQPTPMKVENLESLRDVLRNVTVNGDLNITIQKAKALPVGTVRQWGVYKYVKHNDGWVVVGGEHHGKLMGKFLDKPSHGDFARHHEKTTTKTEESKPDEGAKKVDAGASKKEDSKTKTESTAKPDDRPSTEDVKKLTAQLDERIKARKQETSKKVDEAAAAADEKIKNTGPTPEQTAFKEKNASLLGRVENSGAHKMGLEDFIAHGTNMKRQELYNMNVRPGPNGEEPSDERKKEIATSVDKYMARSKRSITKDLKARHKIHVDAALNAGMDVSPEALKEYPGLGGTDLPQEIDPELNKQTNLVKALDFGKSSEKIKKEFAGHINDCNKLVGSMGIKFKSPLTFKATNLSSLGKRTRGVYQNGSKTIELKDKSAAAKTIMHEIGHALDYAMGERELGNRGRHGEAMSIIKLKPDEATDVHKLYGELHDIVTQSDLYQQTAKRDRSHFKYLSTPTEIFARAFEVYALHKAEEIGMPKEFIDTFMPDVFKTTNQEIAKIREDIDKVVKEMGKDDGKADERNKRYSELRAELKKKTEEDGGEFFTIVPKEKQEEYKKKVADIMGRILTQDQIRKAMEEIDLNEALQKSFKPLPVGTIRDWHGVKYIKHGDGHWMPVPKGNQGGQAEPQKTQAQPAAEEQPKAEPKEKAGPLDHLKPQKGMGGQVKVHSKDLDAALKDGPISIISAGKNPNNAEDRALTEEQINQRYKRLEQDLADQGYKFTKVRGHYGGVEDSFLVYNPNKAEMNQLGKKYNQDSVIHSEGGENELEFTTGENAGKHHKGEGFQDVPEAKDYYTELTTADGQKKKFTLNLDFGIHHESGQKPDNDVV